jgi:hypothetical protein
MTFIIEMTILAREFHVLPQPGGILDQDYLYTRFLMAGLHGLGKEAEMQRKKIGGRK